MFRSHHIKSISFIFGDTHSLTNKNIRSIEFPASFMEQLSHAISGAKKAKMYRQVPD